MLFIQGQQRGEGELDVGEADDCTLATRSAMPLGRRDQVQMPMSCPWICMRDFRTLRNHNSRGRKPRGYRPRLRELQ